MSAALWIIRQLFNPPPMPPEGAFGVWASALQGLCPPVTEEGR